MTIRIATYNFENLFSRPRVLMLPGMSAEAGKILADVEALRALITLEVYDDAAKAAMVEILMRYKFHTLNPAKWFTVQQVREKLYGKRDKKFTIVVNGRAEWSGWVELARELVPDEAQLNTGRVIAALDCHIVCTVEVEDRIALDRFNRQILASKLKKGYPHVMVIDGNDPRGIDVGLLSRFPLSVMRSHIDDTVPGKTQKIFSRDCAEYEVRTPAGPIWVLCNHFKSKGYGSQAANNAKRELQARRVREILGRFDLQSEFVVVAGDFNDIPSSLPLADLVAMPGMRDVLDVAQVSPRWTYVKPRHQIDFMLVSAALAQRQTKAGIERRGLYFKKSPPELGGQPLFPKKAVDAASDHAAVWAEFDL